MERMKRVVCLLLCLFMVAGMLPVGVFATDVPDEIAAPTETAEIAGETVAQTETEIAAPTETVVAEATAVMEAETVNAASSNATVVIAGSDFQPSDDNTDTGANQVTALLNQIKQDYSTASGFLFCGDYEYSSTTSASESTNGKNALQAAVQAVYGTSMDEVYVQGNHDPDSLVTGGTLSSSGAHDAADYGVYVINEKDYMWYNDDETTIKSTASALDAYLDAKVEADYTKPIFVVSHLPLHYSMRTYNDGDGRYANYIFDVLNEAGAAGLNIIFMFGHDHSNGWDDYLGGSAIYLKVGDSINIAQASKTAFDVETLNFTYMNAGYVGYYSGVNTGSETDLTMTAFEITDSTVTVKRYSQSGVHDLKSAGVRNSYKSETAYDPNTEVYSSPQTITLNKSLTDTTVENATVTKEGISVTAPGVTDVTVATETKTVEGYSAYVSYDITLTGYTQGDETTVTVDVDTTLFDASKSVVVLDNGTVIATTAIANGKVTFTTNHFSTYDVAQVAETATDTTETSDWVTVTAPTAAGTRYVYELDTNGVDTGVKYLIVGNSYAKALSAAASSDNAVDITLDGNYAYADSDTYSWTFTKYSGVYYIRLNGSTYLRLNNGSLASSTSTGSDRRWTVSSNGDGSYDITRSGGTTTYNLRWSNSNGVFQASSSNEGPVRLYKYSKTETTAASAGIKGRISGTLEYTFAAGTSEDVIKAAVMAGVTGQWAYDDALDTVYDVTDDQLTWTLNEYDGTAGEYTLTVAYNGITVGTVAVNVVNKIATSISVNPMSGSVPRNSSVTTSTGSTMTVTYDDGSAETLPVTVSMLSGTYNLSKNGSYTGLTITYAGKTVTGYTLNVVNVAGNDFPTYPNPGSVKVGKTGTGLDFQNTGLARINLSTSGLPASKGADVVIVIDTSSSMKDNDVGTTGKTRIEVLSESLEDMLQQFQTANATTGVVPDVDIAIIDFNGYYPSSVGDYDKISLNNSYRQNVDYAKVFTGTNANSYIKNITLSASNFVESTSINASTVAGYFTNENCASGTNYDGALENAYKLLAAKKAANTEEREQYVIFLSDGAPFRYNGFNNGSTKSTYTAWSNWLSGIWSTDAEVRAAITYDTYDTYSYFYNGNGDTHPHRMAEAIKGDENALYDVVLREAAGNDSAYIEQYQGLGATIYSIGFGLADDGNDSEGKVSVATQEELIRVISSGEGYYYKNVQEADELTDAFTQIVTSINYAAQNAVFEDQMGSAYDLQLNPTVKTNADGGSTTTVDTSITVTTYPIYTKAQIGTTVNGHTVTTDDVGKTYGTGTVVETVSFTADSDGNITATSTAVTESDGNILNDGVICAKNFWYNTTSSAKDITLADGSTYSLPAETFYWNIGLINEKQFVLSYVVYLTGSMDGKVPEGSYDTNNYAKLSYTNWLGNDVSQNVASPSMPWGGANVSYAFYLVDSDGNPLLANGTQAANFLEAYKVTQPVLYKTINLNAGETVLSTIADDVLPVGYELYDDTAVYTVTIMSGDGNSNWVITSDSSKKQSTYVVDYAGANDYSNATPVSDNSYDYTHTTVYFAVVWTIGTVPDTVVIDYGLPVDISVLANDMFGNDGTLVGVGAKTDNLSGALSTSYTGNYGTATVNGTEVRYTPGSMEMNSYEKFAYAVNYTGTANPGYYYGDVTVIPATTIYYEDSFVSYSTYSWSNESNGWVENTTTSLWSPVSDESYVEGADITQDEDRPGKYSLSYIDANNIYGYDSAYTECSQYSLGSAMKATVNYDNSARASFKFYGTGFDVISMTDTTTGTIFVDVYQLNADGTRVDETAEVNYVVDTYYGYTRNLYKVTYTYTEGEWVETMTPAMELGTSQAKPDAPQEGDTYIVYKTVWETTTSNDPNALYQVPVMQVEGLPYGYYEAVIKASYDEGFDHIDASNATGEYDFYLDAIRIYDPANDGNSDGIDDTTIENAYISDGEYLPSYYEVRNWLITAEDFNSLTESTDGIVFIDGAPQNTSIDDYRNYGPNNEVYLASGQAIAFLLNATASTGYKVDNIHIGVKTVDGTGHVKIYNGDSTSAAETSAMTIQTATDMYYDITGLNGCNVVIQNSGTDDVVVSITNVKVTYQIDNTALMTAEVEDENETTNSAPFMVTRASAEAAVMSLNLVDEEIESTEPEETQPEVTEPEVTEPEVTEPEVTEPEETEPEETEPEVTVPEETEPEETQPDQGSNNSGISGIISAIGSWIKNIFGKWFK